MDKLLGIDVSKWQGDFNFSTSKAEGVNFAILQGAYHRTKDKKFDAYYSAAKKAGLGVGVYLYAMDKTVADAKLTAQTLIKNCLTGRCFEYPIYYDVEDKTILPLSTTELTSITVAFCDTIKAAGYYPGVYASLDTFNTQLDGSRLLNYGHWVAAWNKSLPTLKSGKAISMWQFGGETNLLRTIKVAGVTCDQDYCYIDYPTIMKREKCNGY
jgi:lysozyme